jgi:hypothetical protein
VTLSALPAVRVARCRQALGSVIFLTFNLTVH